MPRLSYRAARDEHDHETFLRITARSFAFPLGGLSEWLALLGRENLRFVEEKGVPRGALALLPMGQWFGGRAVPMAGIVAVGVEPEVRALGVGKALMEGVLRELGDRGLMISTLFPSTTAFYRRCGYELAGSRYEVRVALGSLRARRPPLSIRRGDEKSEPAVRALYAQQAARSPGNLQRHEYIWGRVKVWRDETRELYLFERGKDLAGYAWLARRRPDPARQEILLSDFVCNGPDAAETLLALLASHRSLADSVVWYGRQDEPLFLALEEAVAPHLSVKLSLPWMTRMVDAPGALEARGYAPALAATLGFELSDPLLALNRGRFRLRVERGRAKVEKGGRGDLRLDVRALSALFTGNVSASALAAAGRIEGSDGAIATADAIFAGPAPAMPDMF
jgi:predicted acetyltransferase